MSSEPGRFPFDAGIWPHGYLERQWTVRQLAGFANSEHTNARFKDILRLGGTGLSVAFDLPTQHGLDPDDPRSIGEVGVAGLSVATVDDLATALHDIPLDRVSVSYTINATAPVIYAMWIVVAEESGIAPSKLRGSLQNEMLKEHLARHAVIYDIDTSLRYSVDLIEYSLQHTPDINPVTISGGHAREAGANAGLELACAFGDADEYISALVDRGLEVDQVASRLSFILGSGMELFAEVAKFRAARKLYAHHMVDRWNARSERSMKFRVHANTYGSALSRDEPLNNIVRATIQALAAVLGGVQSLHVCGFDEGIGLPSALAARIAIRTQQIIYGETDVASYVDPLGGAETIQSLVENTCRDAKQWMSAIDEYGGMLECLRSGWLGAQIDDMAFFAAQRVEAVSPDRSAPEDRLTRSVAKTTAAQDRTIVRRPLPELDAVSIAAAANQNIIPVLIDAVRMRATIGQMSAALLPRSRVMDSSSEVADE